MLQQEIASGSWCVSNHLWHRGQQILMQQGTHSPIQSTDDSLARMIGSNDPYFILATSPPADHLTRVLKQGDTFAVFDHYGDIKPVGMQEEGIYHEGTRFLSSLILGIGRDRPLILSSNVKRDNGMLMVDLTNPDIKTENGIIPHGTVHLSRAKFLWQGCCYERLNLRNHGLSTVKLSFWLHFKADFADIFEVRGTQRVRRGTLLEPTLDPQSVVLSYRGLDEVVRQTHISFSPQPKRLTAGEAYFEVTLRPKEKATFFITMTFHTNGAPTRVLRFEEAATQADSTAKEFLARSCHIYTSNEQFNEWVNRSLSDLHFMLTNTPSGPYPYAGVPWFSTAFGRDGIITAIECLTINPEIARGVLNFLASTQATEVIPEQDAEPGKILHETRRGEMAALGEIPFGRYYGSVDSTPLFVYLAGAYYERTGDREFLEAIWPNLDRALHWIDTYGDIDGDGFVEYYRHSPTGLVQQGWKDSNDSIFHADGTLAEGPIALCEVQAYVYAAKRYAALIASVLGLDEQTEKLKAEAETLRQRFEEAFWCEDLSTYALALDGKKKPCRVRSSNAGQCLFTGIASPARAKRVARTLLREDSFSGWGIRTIASGEARYNPMSYHNGSVWPHDNALIALGFARYRLSNEVSRLLTGMFEASLFVNLNRMPELFCGFPQRSDEGPTLYPVACAPQSWSAAAVFLLLQATLGLQIDGVGRRACFCYPVLPPFLERIYLRNLRIGDASIDVRLHRHPADVGLTVQRRDGDVEIVVLK